MSSILRVLKSIDLEILVNKYKVYTKSILKHRMTVLSPHFSDDIEVIEKF